MVTVLLAIAIAVRLAYYVHNPSVSTDEADLALNLMHRSYAGLFQRLDFNQAAPPGFLVLQKLAVDLFGSSPYALRLVPLLAGTAACVLVHPVTARIAGRAAATIALALFAVSAPLVSYSLTNKQYAVDVAVALALLALMLAIRDRLDTNRAAVLALGGAAAVLLSHPAAFVLAAIWMVLMGESAASRRWRDVANLSAVTLVWLSAFAAAYLLTSASIGQIRRAVADGASGLPAVRGIGGIARYLLGVPGFPAGVRIAITSIALLLGVAGATALLRRTSGLAAALILPAVVAVVAVAVGLYPNFGRTFLFAAPSLIILIATGVGVFLTGRWPLPGRAAAAAVLLMLLGVEAFQTLEHPRPGPVTDSAAVLSYLAEHGRPGDALYVSRTAQYTYRYYVECGCYADASTVDKERALWRLRPTAGYGQFDPAVESAPPLVVAGSATGGSTQEMRRDLEPVLGRRRVWLLVYDLGSDARRTLIAYLEAHGRLLDAFPHDATGARESLLLYTLRR